MARNRLPAAIARVTGADKKNPRRYRGRGGPVLDPLGDPPASLTPGQAKIWRGLASDMPWLRKSDRTLVQIAAILTAAMRDDPAFPMGGYAQLRLCLAAMGGTPSDRTRIPSGDDDQDDPLESFLN